jgi:hypothetical protein
MNPKQKNKKHMLVRVKFNPTKRFTKDSQKGSQNKPHPERKDGTMSCNVGPSIHYAFYHD